MVLSAIQLHDPNFKPVIEPPFPHYVCPLLAHLNDPEPQLSVSSVPIYILELQQYLIT